MSARCIVSVATGAYVPRQERLMESLRSAGYRDAVIRWTNELPPGSPSHEDVPYGFKVFAIQEAFRRGHTSILWLDSPSLATAPLDGLFERIEREGHLLLAGNEFLGNWASDDCLRAFGLLRDRAMNLKLMNGTFIGVDLRNARTLDWFQQWSDAGRRGLFAGPYLSPDAPAEIRDRKPGKSVGFVSTDSRCWGHRHDEAVGSCLAWRLGMPIAAGEEVDCLAHPDRISAK